MSRSSERPYKWRHDKYIAKRNERTVCFSFLQIRRNAEINFLRIRPSYRRAKSGKWILKFKHIVDVKFNLLFTSKFDQVFTVLMGIQTTEICRILPWASFCNLGNFAPYIRVSLRLGASANKRFRRWRFSKAKRGHDCRWKSPKSYSSCLQELTDSWHPLSNCKQMSQNWVIKKAMGLQMLKKIFWRAAITFFMYEHRRNLGARGAGQTRPLPQKKFSPNDFFWGTTELKRGK